MSKAYELVSHWRDIGPVAWAEGKYGWVGIEGDPIKFELWQNAVLSTWWEHRDTVTTLAISNIKKTGKTFTNAVLLAWRWLALPGEHFAVGNDLDQSAGRQFLQITEMVRRHPYLKRAVKATSKQLLFTPTGSTISALAVDAAGNAGANHMTCSHTEAWGIIYEAGIRAYEELTPPPGRFWKYPALRICDSYAGYLGQSDTWHNLVDRGLEGEGVSRDWPVYKNGGLLLFHIVGDEARARCFRGNADEADEYYGDQRVQLRDGAYLRLHENIRATGAESFIKLDWWDACVDPESRPMLPRTDHVLYVGVDGAIKHDSAAVVAVYYDHEEGIVSLARHRIWHPTPGDPLDLDATIGEFLRELSAGYMLSAVYYDPYQLHDLSTRLQADGLPMEEYPQSNPNLTAMSQNLYELLQAGNLRMYPDEVFRRQAAQAVAVENSRGWRIAKEKSSHKIDAIIALAMASLCVVKNPPVSYENWDGLMHVEGFKSKWA